MKSIVCNKIAIPLLVLYYSTIFFTSCFSKAKEQDKAPEKFQVINPRQLDTSFTKEYVADIQSVQNVELRARVKGFIEKIHVDEGRPVKAGQLLFTLSSREFREELLKANAQLKSTIADLKAIEVEIKNTTILTDQNIISKSELEMLHAKKESIEAKMEEARSAIAVANINLSFSQVRAPFNGTINRIPLKSGSMVDEGTLLTSIADNKEMFAYFNVTEREYLSIVRKEVPGKPIKVSLTMADNQLFNQKGIVETSDNEIDKSSGNIAFRARFANPQQLLRHGSSGKILLNTELKEVLIIPQQSTFEVQDILNVYVVDESNTVRIKSFIPKLRLPHLYVVESGLSKNDKVIYQGVQLVKEGDKISPEPVQFEEVMTTLALK